MSTLAKLKEAINNSKSGDSLNSLTKAANNVDLSGLEKSVDSIANRFTFLGNLAFKIKDKIADAFLGMAKTLVTTVPSIIKEGGWQRAMNIEEAKFQLEGLKVAWKDISDDISYAVDGTAYGLDAAAKAASQLVASGVEVGDSMKNALRAISGVAAMTNSEYEAISPIFTTVAGQGKLMTMQLRQLENRGLNAAAVIGEALGKTEAEVREMVTNGEIDFNTFANAMDSAFGEHAKDANRTFTGVTANIRAALKKIGADFATPIIEQDGPVIQALQQLRLRINDIRSSLGPLTDAWTNFVRHYGNDAAKILEGLDMSFMNSVVAGLVNLFQALLNIVRPVLYAIKDIFAPSAAGNINSIASAFESLTKKLILSKTEMDDLRATVRGALSIFSTLGTIIKQILGGLLSVKPETINLREVILKTTGSIGNMLTYISIVVKQFNVLGPIMQGLATVGKVIITVIALGISKIIDLITYINKLGVVPKVINTITTAVKILIGVVITLGGIVANFISETVSKIPDLLASIKEHFWGIVDLLNNIPVLDKVADGIKKLAEAIKKLINPTGTKSSTEEIEGVITIADEAVALAGPKNVTILDRFRQAIEAIGSAFVFVKTKLLDLLSPVISFIKYLGAGGIAALAFTVAIGAIGIKFTKTMESVNKSFSAVTGVLKTLGSDGIMGLIFGKRQQIKIPKILEFALAIAVLAGSLKLMSTVPSNKLKEVGLAMVGMAGGLASLLIIETIAQKIVGKGQALAVSGALITMAASIGIMTASLVALNALITSEGADIKGALMVLIKLSVLMSAMSITIAKLAPQLSTGALALIAMALSVKILVKAMGELYKTVSDLDVSAEDAKKLWGKTGYFVAIGGALVVISAIASKLGVNSLAGIFVSLLALKAIVPLANSVAESIKNGALADLYSKLVAYFEDLKAKHPKILAGVTIALGILAAITAFIGILFLIKKAFAAIASIGSGINKEAAKFAGLQKALARLSLVPVILALTGMMIAIGAMIAILGNIKIANLNQALIIMGAVAVMFATLALVVHASKGSKPATVIAAMVGLTAMFSELIVLTFLIEQHSMGVIGSCAIMAIVMYGLADVFNAISEASKVSGKTLVAIGMIGAIIAELGGIIYALSQQDWKGVAASGAAMFLALEGVSKMLEQLGKTGQTFGKEKMKILAETMALLPLVGASLALATLTHDWSAMLAAGASMSLVIFSVSKLLEKLGKTGQSFGPEKMKILAETMALLPLVGAALALATLTHDWKAMLAAGAAMSLVMVAMGGTMKLLSNTRWDPSVWTAIAGIAISAVAIGGALALATLSHDWQAIGVAAIAMSGVMVVFSGMTYLLGKMNPAQAATSFIAMLSIAVVAVSIGASLALLAQYPWQQIAAAAGVMVVTATLLGVVATILGAPVINQMALAGAVVLDLLSLGFTAMAVSTSVLLAALTAFLPVASAFIDTVLGSIVSFAPSLPAAGEGLLGLAAGLAAVGAAGIVLGLGSIGLVAAALSLPSVVKSLTQLAGVDLFKIASGLKEFVAGGVALAAAGLLLLVATPGISGASVAILAFSVALAALQRTLNPALTKGLGEFANKVQEAKTWGKDLVENFIGGLKSKFSALAQTAKDLAKTIWDYIHFTTPEKGPLSDLDTYGGDMVDELISGISGSTGKLDGCMEQVTSLMKGDLTSVDFNSIGSSIGLDFGNGLDGALSKVEQSTGLKLANIKDMFSQMNMFSLASAKQADSATSTNAAIQEKIALRKSEKEATSDATAAENDYTKAVKSSGGASSKAADDIKDLTDAFKTVEKNTKVSLQSMINNLASNYKETASWARDMKILMGKGFDSSITDWIKKMGVGGHETVKAFMNASESEVAALNAGMKQWLTLDEDAENYILGNYEEFGGKIVEVLSGAVETWDGLLAETVQNAVDPFAEFDAKTELTGSKLLANMNSQLTGIRQWGTNLGILMERNVDQGIIDKFKEMGPASYEQVNAMVNMTDAQIAEANSIWGQQLQLGIEVAKGIAAKSTEIGQGITDGLIGGLDADAAYAEGQNVGLQTVAGAKNGAGVNSPSWKTKQVGEFMMMGLENGMSARMHIPENLAIMTSVRCINQFKQYLSYSAFFDIGKNAMSGLAQGIERHMHWIVDAARSAAQRAYEAAKSALGINSPSKVFRQIGMGIDEGWAQGIDRGSDMVTKSVESLADNTILMMNDIIKNISDEISDSPELQPVIRPELDLSKLQNGKSQIAGLFGNPAYTMATGILASQTATNVNSTDAVAVAPNNQTIIFNQTNNSPKNIDPYESYRLNRLAAEQLKGAFR